MDDLQIRQDYSPALLDSYVQQGQMFLSHAAQNLIQYGRVLTEAKPLLPHGQFGEWVQHNFNMSERSAQTYMQVWKRFGQNENMQKVQFSNLQKMLALPEGTEDQFAAENDLKTMTARQVEQAVKIARGEVQHELDQERTARKNAERRVKELEHRPPEDSEVLKAALADKNAEIERYREQAEQFHREADVALEGQRQALREMQTAKNDLRDAEELLKMHQEEYNRLQTELLNAKSAEAKKGEANREPAEQLTVSEFAEAVRRFMGTVSTVPYMGGTFAQITDEAEYRQWHELLSTVEGWALKSLKAMQTIEQRGDIING